MRSRQESRPWDVWRLGGDGAVFFLLVYLYVWLVVDPRLIHHSIGILSYYYPFSFHTGWAFFQEHLARPGGLAEYAVRLLSQFYAFGWAGALIVTAAAWHGCLSTDALCGASLKLALPAPRGQVLCGASLKLALPPPRGQVLCGASFQLAPPPPRGQVLRYVPAVLLLAMYGSYSHPLGAVLPLLIALSGFLLYVRWAPQGPWKRLPILVFACAILYHVAGSGSLLFPIMVAVYESLVQRRAAVALAALLCGLAVPWIAGTLFSLDLGEAYGSFLVSDPGVPPGRWPFTLALYLFFPGLLAGAIVGRAAWARRASRARRRPRDKAHSSRIRKAALFLLSPSALRPARAALVLLGAAAAAWFSLDTLSRTVLKIDYHSQREQWAEALTAARKLPAGAYNVRCHRNVMLALYHTGRLGDEMFRYPQRPGVELFSTPGEARDAGTYYQESRFFLELGQVNQAEKCACEALETCGDLPALLEELALINVLKGRPETSRIFLNALAQHPLHRCAASEMLDRLEADPAMDGDARVSRIRRNMVAKDHVAMNTTVEEFLQALLEKNPHNQMAFEFLVAHHLAVGRPDKVVACLVRLKDFSYRRVPLHYQEAATIYAQAAGRLPVVPGYDLDAAVLARAGEFGRILSGARSQEDAARTALAAGFGDSYFFYFAFGASGL